MLENRRRSIGLLECEILKAINGDPEWLSGREEMGLRFALSLARLTQVLHIEGDKVKEVPIGHALDAYRDSLFHMLSPEQRDGQKELDKSYLLARLSEIEELAFRERKALMRLLGDQLSLASLDAAIRKRPLAIAMSGGGGTSYIFAGAFSALEKAGLRPDGMSGTSMGAIIGAFRALHEKYDLEFVKRILSLLSWRNLAEPLTVGSQFGAPATFRLRLREIFGTEFERSGVPLRLKDLAIPLRIAVVGLSYLEGHQEPDLSAYSNLLGDVVGHIYRLRNRGLAISQALLNLAKQPLKAIYLGGDALTREFDVVDAIGFSAAVPGIFQYEITREDSRMEALLHQLFEEQNVFRLIDGGFRDNLPVAQAIEAVQTGCPWGRDPFVLALDGFAPNLMRHWLFLPVMHMISDNTKQGKTLAHLTIAYRKVLSPLTVVPTKSSFETVVHNGIEETRPYLPLIAKILEPINYSLLPPY